MSPLRVPGEMPFLEMEKDLGDGNIAQYTVKQAEGAIPNGTRVRKINTDIGDYAGHQDGAEAVVIGSLRYGEKLFYFVYWDDNPEIPTGITEHRIEVIDE